MKHQLKTNILLFIIAIPLALLLFYFLDNPTFFSASVISLQEKEAMKQNKWDIGYKNEGNILDVYLDDNVSDLDYLIVSIVYDDKTIEISTGDLSVQTDYEIISHDTGTLLIQFKNFSSSKFDYTNSLFELKYAGDEPSILISQASAAMFTGNNKLLSVGSLNKYKKSHN